MWQRRFSSYVLICVGAWAQGNELEAMLNRFEAQRQPSAAQMEENLTQLSGGLRQWGGVANPRVRLYLNQLQGAVGTHRGLGLAVSGLYRQLGGVESNPQLAWLGFRNAFLLLNRLPMDAEVRGEMQKVRRSVEVVEARMPDLPRIDWTTLDAGMQKEYDVVMERYITVSSLASSAEVTAETMRRSLAEQGLIVRPETVAALTRLKLKMEDSRRLIEQKNYGAAKERLASAEAEAQKILKSFGG
ncbi:MAG: hypothetical protein K7J46_17205 [Bryobacter sp.]|jgi:hypothetical protein|nr:hypothetical protein [Bryobacter sp. CoA8 C33]